MSIFDSEISEDILDLEYASRELGISPQNIRVCKNRLILMNDPKAPEYIENRVRSAYILDAMRLKEVCETLGIRKIENQLCALTLRGNKMPSEEANKLCLRGLSIRSGVSIYIEDIHELELDHCDLTTTSNEGSIKIYSHECTLSCSGLRSGTITIRGLTALERPRIHAINFLGIGLRGPEDINQNNLWEWLGNKYKIYKPESPRVRNWGSANIRITKSDGLQETFEY